MIQRCDYHKHIIRTVTDKELLVLALPVTVRVILGKSCNNARPQFPYLYSVSILRLTVKGHLSIYFHVSFLFCKCQVSKRICAEERIG